MHRNTTFEPFSKITLFQAINQKRTNDWRITSGLQLPMEAAILISSKNNIPNENHLVQLKKKSPL